MKELSTFKNTKISLKAGWSTFLKEFEDLATLGLCVPVGSYRPEPALQSVLLPLPAWPRQAFVWAILEYDFKNQPTSY